MRRGAGQSLALAVAVTALMTGVLGAGLGGAAQPQLTIGLIQPGPGSPTAPEEASGGQAAAAALGDQVAITPAGDAPAEISAIKSLIAQHAAAIAISTDEDPTEIKDVLPALAQARAAGIPTLSFESERFPGTLWVSQSSPAQYARALADALASQMKGHGQFITVPCNSGFAIVKTWTRDADTYIQHRYPRMHRVATVMGGTGNGPAGTLVLRPLLTKYPHLRGFIFICPGEAYTEGPQLVAAHKIGKVFAAGNGADCPPLYRAYADNVRSGAEEIVCAGDPNHLGYLTVWAADHLARGHMLTFTPGSYDAGGPVGTVRYYSRNQELRLGRPLTITKANLAKYAG